MTLENSDVILLDLFLKNDVGNFRCHFASSSVKNDVGKFRRHFALSSVKNDVGNFRRHFL